MVVWPEVQIWFVSSQTLLYNPVIPKLKIQYCFSTTDSDNPLLPGDEMVSWLERAFPLWVGSDGKANWERLGDLI